MASAHDNGRMTRMSGRRDRRGALIALFALAGFGLTVLALYPGYMTVDAAYVYSYIEGWRLGDWQSPLMTVLWWAIDPIAPGPGSMFLLTGALYWAGFGLLALTLARSGRWTGMAA